MSNSILVLGYYALSYYIVSRPVIKRRFSTEREKPYGRFTHSLSAIISNIAFLLVGFYQIVCNAPLMGVFSILIGLGSTLFHLLPLDIHDVTNRVTLTIARVPMIWMTCYIMSLLYQLDFVLLSVIGLITVYHWYHTADLLPYAAFQLTFLISLFSRNDVTCAAAATVIMLAEVCKMYDKKKGHAVASVLSAIGLVIISNVK